MKTLEISDEVYDSLKAFVIDPFDDTPNAVLRRLIDIANKAQSRWSAFETPKPQQGNTPQVNKVNDPNSTVPHGTRISDDATPEGAAVVL